VLPSSDEEGMLGPQGPAGWLLRRSAWPRFCVRQPACARIPRVSSTASDRPRRALRPRNAPLGGRLWSLERLQTTPTAAEAAVCPSLSKEGASVIFIERGAAKRHEQLLRT
jgi:hypothetical protein